MSRLIEELEGDHVSLLATLEEVSRLGICSPEGRAKMVEARHAFLQHLAKEDRSLYPPIRNAAESDPSLARMLNIFGKGAEDVSRTVFDFFDRHSDGAVNGSTFATDIGRLFAVLKIRIRKEETVLYPEYKRIAELIAKAADGTIT